MQRTVLNKVLLAKRILGIARDHIAAVNELSLSVGVNLMQDSVEVFLLAVAEHVSADIGPRTTFDQYFEAINRRIQPKQLPLKARLIALNRLRVNAKHYGIAPARTEVEGVDSTVRNFFEDVTEEILGAKFSTASLLDTLEDSPPTKMVREAEVAFHNAKYDDCLIACRKAIFLRMEQQFDVSPFAGKTNAGVNALLSLGNKAPTYARSPNYISQNVKDPTDFIVFDHSALEMELLTAGMDRTAFWNVWRLTPEVFQSSEGGDWMVKYDLAKLEDEGIQERAEYVLDATIALLIAEQQTRKGQRWSQPEHQYVVTLVDEDVPIYEKADLGSCVVGRTPRGMSKIVVDYWVPALSGSEVFWHVTDFGEYGSLWGFLSSRHVSETSK